MQSILKRVLAVIVGIVAGSVINGGIIAISPYIIPPPQGVNVSDEASLKAGIHLFEAKHFIMPFLAHALGTLAGAFAAAKIADKQRLWFATIIAIVFFAGGVMMVLMLPGAPLWFSIVDLVFAYFPMAFLGYWLGKK